MEVFGKKLAEAMAYSTGCLVFNTIGANTIIYYKINGILPF